MKTENQVVDRKILREFGLLTGGIIAGLFGLFFPWLLSHPIPVWPWAISGVLISLAIVLPASLKPIYRAWMAFGAVLGWINTRIILGVIYYLVFLPAGIIMKLLGKDPLSRNFDAKAKSYRVNKPTQPKNHVERPY